MKSGVNRRIALLDLNGERGDFLCAQLHGAGTLAQLTEIAELSGCDAEFVIVDPPESGLSATRLRSVARAAAGRPLLVLGVLPNGEWPGIRSLAGALLPARLASELDQLVSIAASGAPARWSELLAPLIALSPGDRTRLERLQNGPGPVLLIGEPGSGKSLLARGRLCSGGTRLRRIELPVPTSLTSDPRLAIGRPEDGELIYLAVLDELPVTEVDALRELVEQSFEGTLRLALGGHDRERSLARLPDDLRLLLGPATVALPTLRGAPTTIPALFGRVLSVLAVRHGAPVPVVSDEIDAALSAWAWPLNFEELVACARRALLAAEDRPMRREDLGLPSPARDQPREREQEAGRRNRAVRQQDAASNSPAALDGLVQELAHEIKNPLVSVKTFTQLLSERFDDAEFRDQYYRLVSSDVDRIDAVLGELDEYARLRTPQPESLAVGQLLARSLENQQFQIRKRMLEVTARVPERWGEIDNDPLLLGYVIDGVLREAVTAMVEGAKLDIAPLPARGARVAQSPGLVFRYRIAPDSPAAARGDSKHHMREVIGLRHALAARVLALLGGTLAIEDTIEGETRVTVTFNDLR